MWPTPRNQDAKHGEATGYELGRDPDKDLLHVRVARETWPTPNSRDWKDTGPTQGNRKAPNLGTAVHWPTPRSSDSNGPGLHGDGGMDLRTAVLLPTPNARDWKGLPGAPGRARGGRQSSLPVSVGSGRLNPTWVEWLMGFPLGWTDCGRSATRSSPRSPRSSATASSPLTLF